MLNQMYSCVKSGIFSLWEAVMCVKCVQIIKAECLHINCVVILGCLFGYWKGQLDIIKVLITY